MPNSDLLPSLLFKLNENHLLPNVPSWSFELGRAARLC